MHKKVYPTLSYVFNPAAPGAAETPTGKSLTVPDETMTVQQLMQQFTSGLMPDIQHSGPESPEDMTFDEQDFEKVKQMDIYDQEMLIHDTRQGIKTNVDRFREFEKDVETQKLSAAQKAEEDKLKDDLFTQHKSAKSKQSKQPDSPSEGA